MKAICGTIKAFPVKEAHPHGIVYNSEGPLKGLWFDNATTDDTSSVVEFDTRTGTERRYLTPTQGSQPGSINIAADRSIWFTESVANKLAVVTHERTIKEYPVPTPDAYPLDITRGPDGAMWFVESNAGKIGRIAPDGKIQEFRTGDSASRPTALITGPDKAIWFTEVGTNRIGRLTTTGSVSHFSAGAGQMTGDITTAIDDSFWFGKKNAVTRMTASGALTEYEVPNAIDTGSIFGSRNGGVFIGVMHKDGTGSVTAISADGKLKEFDLPQKHLMPIEFAQTADGSFWMTVQSFDASASPSQLFNLPLPAVTDLPRTTIVTGGGPDWMATGAGALWIANISLKEIERIDAATNAITARIKVERRSVFGRGVRLLEPVDSAVRERQGYVARAHRRGNQPRRSDAADCAGELGGRHYGQPRQLVDGDRRHRTVAHRSVERQGAPARDRGVGLAESHVRRRSRVDHEQSVERPDGGRCERRTGRSEDSRSGRSAFRDDRRRRRVDDRSGGRRRNARRSAYEAHRSTHLRQHPRLRRRRDLWRRIRVDDASRRSVDEDRRKHEPHRRAVVRPRRRRDSLQLRHDLARRLRPPSRLADQTVARSLRAEGYIV